jgi:hypothetical protein
MHSTQEGNNKMREELRDCPLGEMPMLAPELISTLRQMDASRVQFDANAARGARIDLRFCADHIHDAVLEPDGEFLVAARPRMQTPPAA